MGEINEAMLDGVLCQECGQFIDDEASGYETGPDGYPRFCRDCGGDPACNGAAKRKRKGRKRRRQSRPSSRG